MKKFKEHFNEDGPCWDSHKQVGMKKKGNRMVPNCVPKEAMMDNMCCKYCGDMFGKPTVENKGCQYNAYDPKGKNWINAEKKVDEALKYNFMVLDRDGRVMGMSTNERDAMRMAKGDNIRGQSGRYVKLRRPMAQARGDRLMGQLPAHNLGEDQIQRDGAKIKKAYAALKTEISVTALNKYYDKAKQSHDRAGNSAFARHLRKEPGMEKDLDTMRRRKAGIKLATNRAIKRLRGEIK